MPSQNERTAVELSTRVIGNWKETYQWIPVFGAFATIAMAFSAGANNIPAPFSTPVGSGAWTLLKASATACLIYVLGAAFASKSTVDTLFSDFLQQSQPSEGFLMWGLVVVLVTATIWLALATYLELPVSSQQSTQSALLGTMLVAEGFQYLPLWNKNENHNFNGGGLLWIFLEWTVAPLVACVCAYLLFTGFKTSLLRHENVEKRVLVFLPIDYGISAGLLCLFFMYQVLGNITKVSKVNKVASIVAAVVAGFIGGLLSLFVVVPLARKRFDAAQNYKTSKENISLTNQCPESQEPQDQTGERKMDDEDIENMLKDFMQMRVLDTVYEEEERSFASPDIIQESKQVQTDQSVSQSTTTAQSTAFKQLLGSTQNRLVQTRSFKRLEKTRQIENAVKFIRHFMKSTVHPVIDYDRKTLIRHALAEKYDEMEDWFSFPQILASCMFALIQSATEIAALASPYGAILDVFKHRSKYSGNGEDVGHVQVVWWFRGIGGLFAALGFFLCGWRMSQGLGGKLTYISNSRGLASQLSTVAAMILVSWFKLPVSSIHAFVGSLVGVGVADDPRNVNWKLLAKYICGWVMTIVFCCGIAYVIFSASIHTPAYVVP